MPFTPTDTWRLLLTPPADGATNMAIDEAVLDAVGEGISAPTLRLYAWEPACLSVGYAQPLDQVDRARLALRGWGLVRRPTGGRAILHADELTYSVIAPASHPIVAGGVLPSYRRLSAALSASLKEMGLVVETHPEANPGDAERSNPICFVVPSAYELTVGGKKLVGSAQVRRRASVLQHGSLPLAGDLTRILDGLHFDTPGERAAAVPRMIESAATVESLTGRLVTWERAAECWINGFKEALDLAFRLDGLTLPEARRVKELRSDRYLNPSWTERV
jgi:lipoate-protein ligase A